MSISLPVSVSQESWKDSARWLSSGSLCGFKSDGGWESVGLKQLGVGWAAHYLHVSSLASVRGLIWTPKARCTTFYDLASEVRQYRLSIPNLKIWKSEIQHAPKSEIFWLLTWSHKWKISHLTPCDRPQSQCRSIARSLFCASKGTKTLGTLLSYDVCLLHTSRFSHASN